MRKRRFIQCDVFTATPTKGNGLAVVVDGDGLSDQQMLDFAAWTNLAETTFLQTPTDSAADYRVRIFTPEYEMLFAGHPTLGSCAAWLKTGHMPKNPHTVIQQCGIGLVEIDISQTPPAFVAPPTKIAPLPDQTTRNLLEALDISPDKLRRTALLDNGPVWQLLEVNSAEDVLAVDAAKIKWPEFVGVSLFGAYPDGSACAFETRHIFRASGITEDPITGSLSAAIARWLLDQGRLTKDIVISQGSKIGREGRVYISLDRANPDRVYIGGEIQMLIEGTVEL
ncbi:MAG: PhzF family phenazine biosynthesis protein [Paracoccaceae bacterium]